MATVSYGMKIKNENHIFDKTIEVYRDAVKYLTNIVLLHYDTISGIQGYGGATAQQCRRQYVEMLVHTTEKNDAVYKKFDEDFYKFPSYLRRDAITTAIGNVMSYKSLV